MQFGKQYREVKLRYVYLFLHSFEETCLYERLYFKVIIVVIQEITKDAMSIKISFI